MKKQISEIVERFKPEVLPFAEDLPERFQRWKQAALARIANESGIAGCLLIVDEVGSADWQTSKVGGSKVELIRARLEALEASRR